MSVYYKEDAKFFWESIRSIYNQTIPTDDFVLVCDGPLGVELDKVICDARSLFKERIHIIRLKNNHGLGYALNIGLKKCKNELVARMDSDDISMVDRCERQLSVFENNPNIDIVSGYVQEFDRNPGDMKTVRIVPKTSEHIRDFSKKRNPFNHPCVMYKKSKVLNAGGYKQFYMLEDYYLWVRMLMDGAIGYNIQDPILYMRVGNGMYKRRSGWKHAKSQVRLFKYMYDNGFITLIQYIKSAVFRTMASLVPNSFRKKIYNIFLRSKAAI